MAWTPQTGIVPSAGRSHYSPGLTFNLHFYKLDKLHKTHLFSNYLGGLKLPVCPENFYVGTELKPPRGKEETLVTAGTWPDADERQSQQRKAGAHGSCVTAGHPSVLFHFLKIAARGFCRPRLSSSHEFMSVSKSHMLLPQWTHCPNLSP